MHIHIGKAEAGWALRRFLENRFGLPRTMIYRWLRSGQVRVNAGRCKGGRILLEGDLLRLPPQIALFGGGPVSGGLIVSVTQDRLGLDLPIVYQDDDLLALNKPAGLAVQGGSGQQDCVTRRLRLTCDSGFFTPAPVHRLDKPASGLLLVGKTHAALQSLHALFQGKSLEKEYLCWVKGDFSAHDSSLPLADLIHGREAKAFYQFQAALQWKHGTASLLRVRLITGRKHQIRLQLSLRGFPLVGDLRYKGPDFPQLLLHAVSLRLPHPKPCLYCPPNWPEPFMPKIIESLDL